jgi:hypothetical protein
MKDTIGMVFAKHYTDAKFRDHHIHQGLHCSRTAQKNTYHKNQLTAAHISMETLLQHYGNLVVD